MTSAKFLKRTADLWWEAKCSVCGIRKSKYNTLDKEKTWKAVNINSEIGAFFIFYQSRCPLKNLHEWKDNKCTKCESIFKSEYFKVQKIYCYHCVKSRSHYEDDIIVWLQTLGINSIKSNEKYYENKKIKFELDIYLHGYDLAIDFNEIRTKVRTRQAKKNPLMEKFEKTTPTDLDFETIKANARKKSK